MVTILNCGTRTARKRHICFHCCRDIVPGTKYGFQTNKYDDVYTLSWHLDCEELAKKCRNLCDYAFDDGWPGLRDEWCDNGEYFAECDAWRGFYPHVIARMELTDQLRKAKP
jgi:hypothetical protein